MDDYTREVMDVKSIVTRSLEKKGVLSKIRAELRANVFEAIEDEDKVVEKQEGLLPQALLGSCNDRARQLHASPSGRLLSALVCEYLEWAQLEHSLKVYQPECNLENDSWKSALGDFVSNKNGDSGPRLLDVLEGFLKFESKAETMNGRVLHPKDQIEEAGLVVTEKMNSSGEIKMQQKRAGASCFEMDDYTREMMDLKTLVTRTLEKKGVLAKIRAELRASVFEAIEEEDRVIQNNQVLPPALLGSCNDRARRLHASPSGRLLSALVCEYLDWAQLNHTLKVYQPECNLPKESWKSELRDFSSNSGYELNRNGDSKPLLLDVLEGFFKFEAISSSSRRDSETESSSTLDSRNPPGISSASDSLPQRRSISASQASGPTSGYRNDEHSWRYESEDGTEEVMRASTALANLQLDRKTRNLTSSWRRNVRDGTSEEAGKD
ncbi:hypothetical protein Bca101_021316 [Brassica carinata]